jgi:serine/threonine protein kinase
MEQQQQPQQQSEPEESSPKTPTKNPKNAEQKPAAAGAISRIRDEKRTHRKHSDPVLIRSRSKENRNDNSGTAGNPANTANPANIKICKFLIPQERFKIIEKAESIKFSEEELKKAESLQRYFQQYWHSLVRTYNARRYRQQAVEQYLDKQDWDETKKADYRLQIQKKERQLLRSRRIRITIHDFALLAIVGRGGFGEVYLCQKRDTGEVLALKKLSKKHFIKKNNVWKLKRERDVMIKSHSPWIIKLKYSFQSDKFVYLAMEFVPGGDMKNLLDHVGCFAEPHARFYFAEMVLAVRDLHKLGYIHRDLKPDNFMVDRRGHLKLIDFGLSKDGHSIKYEGTISLKQNKSEKPRQNLTSPPPGSRHRFRSGRKLYSVVGSPEYMAIEVLEETGYNHTVDYWSLGVIMFELFYGITPFNSDTTEEALQKLICWKNYLIQPEPVEPDELPISEAGWDLITRLICEPSKRIGRVGIEEIMNHAWFKGFDWNRILDSEPPFVPDLEGELDTSYFQHALDEQDYRTLSINFATVQQLLEADVQDIDKILMHGKISKTEEDLEHRATHFKNTGAETAFAGWTFKHDYLSYYIEQLDESYSDEMDSTTNVED